MFGERFELFLEASDLGFVVVGLAVVTIDLCFHAGHLCFLPIDHCPALVLGDFLFEMIAFGLGFVVALPSRLVLVEQLFVFAG